MSEQAVFNPDGLIRGVNGAAMIRPRSSVVHLAAIGCNTAFMTSPEPSI